MATLDWASHADQPLQCDAEGFLNDDRLRDAEHRRCDRGSVSNAFGYPTCSIAVLRPRLCHCRITDQILYGKQALCICPHLRDAKRGLGGQLREIL